MQRGAGFFRCKDGDPAKAALGAAIGGQAGAAAALDNINHNFLNHQQIDDLIAELISCNGSANVEDCKREVSEKYTKLDFEQEKALDNCRSIQCIADVLGDISDAQDFDYLKLLSVQTAGADENLVQRLLGYQGTDVFGQRLLTVISGAAYCDQTGGAEGCFGTGIRNQFIKEAAVDLLVELGSSASFGAVSRIIRFLKESKKGGNIVSSGGGVGEGIPNNVIPDGWQPIGGVGAQMNTPRGFTTYRTLDGDLVHVSPGGLQYGADPKFGNRVDHVLDHTAPNPNKPVHTVFNVKGDDALNLVDEAWARRGVPDPTDPYAFVVDMGRPIGTNGETSIRIVTMTPGGSTVRTAYPWP